MTFIPATEPVEVIARSGGFFLGKSSQWVQIVDRSVQTDKQLCLGYETDIETYIMPLSSFSDLRESSDNSYVLDSDPCTREACTSQHSVRSDSTPLHEFPFCPSCHDEAVEEFEALIQQNKPQILSNEI